MVSTLGFGSWGMSKPKTKNIVKDIELVKFAYSQNISFFDTAPVYGEGYSENILSNLPFDTNIATKIPGIRGANSFKNCYPKERVFRSIEDSVERLSRVPYLIQFHNWDFKWVIDEYFFNLCQNILEKYNTSKIGISLPKIQDGNNIFEEPFISGNKVEYFQVAWNISFQDNVSTIKKLNSINKKVILRSIFDSGKLLKLQSNSLNIYKSTLIHAFDLKPAIIMVGISKKKHVVDLLNTIKEIC